MTAISTQPHGAQLQSRDSFLYGKFECMLRPGYGSGIVSSFFLFNDDPGFQKNWAEVDLEFLGRNTNQVDTNVIRTVGTVTDKNVNVQHHTLGKRSSDLFWKLSIEWLPDRVIWKVNDAAVRTLHVQISKKMKLMMNVWASSKPGWAGDFHPGLLPQHALYEYVRVSSFVNGEFILQYQDSFKFLDLQRWMVADWMIDNTVFVKGNVAIEAEKLKLSLT